MQSGMGEAEKGVSKSVARVGAMEGHKPGEQMGAKERRRCRSLRLPSVILPI